MLNLLIPCALLASSVCMAVSNVIFESLAVAVQIGSFHSHLELASFVMRVTLEVLWLV